MIKTRNKSQVFRILVIQISCFMHFFFLKLNYLPQTNSAFITKNGTFTLSNFRVAFY